MRITKRQLRKIIKEERKNLTEYWNEDTYASKHDAYDKLEKAIFEATASIGEDAVLKFLKSFVQNY